MPPTPVKVDFKAQVSEMRKAFKEMKKLQGDHQKRAQQQMRAEKKQQKEDLAANKKLFQEKKKEQDKEFKEVQKLHREKQKQLQQEARHRQKKDRDDERAKRRDKDHVRGMGREVKRSGLGSLLMGGAAFAGGGILGMLIGGGLKGYQNHLAAQQAIGGAIGLGGRPRKEAGSSARGGNLGYNVVERAGMMQAMGRSTGVISPRAMMTGSRATGMGAGELASIYGAIRRGGTQFDGGSQMLVGGQLKDIQQKGSGQKEFAKMIELGMVSGLERARLPEYFESVTSLMEQQEQSASGKVGHNPFSRFLSVMGQFGKDKGLSGFQGSRGGALMGKLHQGIIQPGGGEGGQALIQQAMGFGTPGGGTSYYQAEEMREKGLSDPKNFDRIMTELKRQSGTKDDAALRMRSTFGVSLDQAEQLIALSESSASMDDKMKSVDEVLAESKSLEEQALSEFKKSGGALERIAGRFDTMAGVGGKLAKYIEAVEDMQLKLMLMLMDLIPSIEKGIKIIAEVLGELFEWVKKAFPIKSIVEGVGATFTGGGSFAAEEKEAAAAFQKVLKAGPMERDAAVADAMKKFKGVSGKYAQTPEQFAAGDEAARQRGIKENEQKASEVDFIRQFYDAAGIDTPGPADITAAKNAAYKAVQASKSRENGQSVWTPSRGKAVVKAEAARYGRPSAISSHTPAPPGPAPSPAAGSAAAPAAAGGGGATTQRHIHEWKTPPGENVQVKSSSAPVAPGRADGAGRP